MTVEGLKARLQTELPELLKQDGVLGIQSGFVHVRPQGALL